MENDHQTYRDVPDVDYDDKAGEVDYVLTDCSEIVSSLPSILERTRSATTKGKVCQY